MIKKFLIFLDRFEKQFPHIFWLGVSMLSLVWNFLFNEQSIARNQNQFLSDSIHIVQNVSNQTIEVKDNFELEIFDNNKTENLDFDSKILDNNLNLEFSRVTNLDFGSNSLNENLPAHVVQKEEKSEAPLVIDFKYTLDKNGDPIIFVRNTQRDSPFRIKYFKVTFDQTVSHLDHASDVNIELPSGFKLNKYLKLGRLSRIKYAKKVISRNKLIEYQNRLAKELSDPHLKHCLGYVGTSKIQSGIIIKKYKSNLYTISIVNVNGVHILTYKANRMFLLKLRENNYCISPNLID